MLPDAFGLPAPPWIVAHRGASGEHPENTLVSLSAAVAQGAHMLEIDLQLAADGEIVAVHDFEVDTPWGERVVEETPAQDLRALLSDRSDPGAPFPTLAEILAAVHETTPLNLEIKRRHADVAAWTDRLVPLLAERRRILLSSFDWELLGALRRRAPEALLAPIGSRKPHDLLRAAEHLGAASVHCHRRLAFGDFLTAASASGWPVIVYTINQARQARDLFARGAAGVFTDLPGKLLGELDL